MMGAAGITNVGPINTPTTNAGAIAGFDPIMKLSKRANKKKENGICRKAVCQAQKRSYLHRW